MESLARPFIAAIDFEGGLEDAWRSAVTFVPKLVGFLVILLIGWFLAKALSKVVDALLERVGFDGMVERGALASAFQKSNVHPSDIAALIVFWAVFLIALQLAFGIFGPNPISDLIEGLIGYLPKLFVAVVILVITAALAKVVTDLLAPVLGAVSGGGMIAKGAGIAILVVGIFAALSQLQIAPEIVNGLFYALLILVVGSAVIAFGAGGIPVARKYLEQAAGKVQEKSEEIKDKADPDAGKQAAKERMEQEKQRIEQQRKVGASEG